MLFYVLFVCKCVRLPPGVNPIAVKYIYIYIISYHIIIAGSLYTANDTWCIWTAAQPQLRNQCSIHYGAVVYQVQRQSYKFIWTVVQFLAGATDLSPPVSWTDLGPPQPHHQCVLGTPSLEIMKLWHKVDLSPLSNAKVRNECHYMPSWHRQKHNFCCALQ
jgi:hypothetical protein